MASHFWRVSGGLWVRAWWDTWRDVKGLMPWWHRHFRFKPADFKENHI
jgi:hypothetical protein